jgi:putative phosphoribosyl transferase
MVDVRNKSAILIDDGLATGASMKAAVSGVLAHDPDRVVVAVPVAAPEICARFQTIVDEIICSKLPKYFSGWAPGMRTFLKPVMKRCANY